MATNSISIKEKAKRAYDEGMRVGPGKQVGIGKKDQLKGLEYHLMMKQILMNDMPEASRRAMKGSSGRSKEAAMKESFKKYDDFTNRAGTGNHASISPIPVKTVKTPTFAILPTVTNPSPNEIENLKGAFSLDLPSSDESSFAHQLKKEILKMQLKAGFTGVSVQVIPWFVSQPDGTKIEIPSKFLVKISCDPFCL